MSHYHDEAIREEHLKLENIAKVYALFRSLKLYHAINAACERLVG